MTSRRGFLRLAGSIALSAGILLTSEGLIHTQLFKNTAENLVVPCADPCEATDNRASLITVKVYYTMMAQYTNLSEEDFVLQSTANVKDLMSTCVVRHPSMAQMIGTMLVLLNGAPSKPSAALRDGDSVQFIPLSAGG